MKFDKRRAAKIGRGVAKYGSRAFGDILGAVGKIFLSLFLVIALTGMMMACIFASYVNNELTEGLGLDLSAFTLDQSSVIYAYNDDTEQWEELVTLYSNENRVWAGIDEIPDYMKYAAVSIEDKRFYKHRGVDWFRTVAAFGNLFSGARDTYGASTITQQLIKNITQQDQVTVERKLTEIFQAIEFEKTYSKDQILEYYLNAIYLGNRCYGVSSAAYTYFGKELQELTITECAAIISITNNPSIYDPFINPESNKTRRELILAEMYKNGYITGEQYSASLYESENLTFGGSDDEQEDEQQSNGSCYTWFEDLVIEDVIAAFQEDMDISYEWAEKMLFRGGYQIYCTLDMDVQAIVDEYFSDPANLPQTTGSQQQLLSGMTIIDNETGCVVAVCGGIGEKTGSRSWSTATDTLRPPGSSLKPLSVYSPAIERGLITPISIVDDAPLPAEVSGTTDSWPRNDDWTYTGLITVREGLRRSRNAVAARILVELTPEVSYDFLTTRYGFTSLVVNRTSSNGSVFTDVALAPLALGQLTDGASTREMAQAYCTFPNDGMYRQSRTFLYITDSDGEMILDNQAVETQAVSAKTAYYMNDMLTNAVQTGTGYEARIDGMTVAGKTGTTGDNCDRWFCGYTPYYTAAVWTGYDMPETIRMANGGNPAAQIWQNVMSKIHEGLEDTGFTEREDLVSVNYCTQCGLLVSSYTTDVGTAYICKEDVPTEYCSGNHWSDITPENWTYDYETGEWRDSITGWKVDAMHAMLVHPDTGELFTQEQAEEILAAELEPTWYLDSGTERYRDSITGWFVSLKDRKLTDPDTGELLSEAEAVERYVENEHPEWTGSYSGGYTDIETGWSVDLGSKNLVNPDTGELCSKDEAVQYIQENPRISEPDGDVGDETGEEAEEGGGGLVEWLSDLFGR